jgi:hypothetical protein
MSHSYHKNVYRHSRRFDVSCRCNGACGWCRGNRFHSILMKLPVADDFLGDCLEEIVPKKWVSKLLKLPLDK